MARRAEMRESWLVQRLQKPRGGPFASLGEVFSFGGGYKNGGLSDDAMSLLRNVFCFDYMGAAEFEFGAVPSALSGLAQDRRNLIAFTVSVPLRIVPPNWRDKSSTQLAGDGTVYVLCRSAHADEIRRRVSDFATGTARTKERVGLDSALRPFNEWDGETVGWLELDNGYLFFTDASMWSATAGLFGVTVDAAVSS